MVIYFILGKLMTLSPKIHMTLPRESGHIAYNRFESGNKDLPEVVFLGGYKSDMNGTKATFLDDLCRKRNQSYTRFDYFGHGSSSGDFIDGTISQWVSDSLAIIDEITKGPLILIGSSLGGWLMTRAALARPQRVKALVGIAAAPDFTEDLIWATLNDEQQKEFLKTKLFHLPSTQDLKGIPVPLSFIEDGRKNFVLRDDLNITCPVHLLHGTLDADVPWTFSHRLSQRLKSADVSLTLIKDGDHSLTSPFSLEMLTSILEHVSRIKT